MTASERSRPRGLGVSVSGFFYRHRWAKLLILLLPAVVWLVVLYLGSIGGLLAYSFWSLEEFTGLIDRTFTLATYGTLWEPANRDIVIRTVLLAATVTIACSVLAFPLAYYMARYASRRARFVLYLAVLMPLWSSYLVRALAWRQIFAREGVLYWAFDRIGLDGVLDAIIRVPLLGGSSLLASKLSLFVVYTYLWLPFMILPLEAALERVPHSFMEASSDLGARKAITFRRIVLPLVKPGLIAGSIFTFSLTLGDFVLPTMLGGSELILGQQVLTQIGTAGNIPLAAAFTFVAMAIMVVYLMIAKRAGAFESL
ncbi:MAG TPA: ABC transporter permease [Actinomycetota bacterium]|nr:ABC transporter permease [Actinomycetota bacterium]